MKIVNLTPHTIYLDTGDRRIEFLSQGLARVASTTHQLGSLEVEVNGETVKVPVSGTRFGEVTGLPDPVEGTVYLTSALVAEAATKAGRTDVLAPGTGPNDGAIRDEANRLLAVTRFVRIGG